jgi:hypothetical protein
MAALQGCQKITKFNFGRLLQKAWSKPATFDYAESEFRSTEIFSLNPYV